MKMLPHPQKVEFNQNFQHNFYLLERNFLPTEVIGVFHQSMWWWGLCFFTGCTCVLLCLMRRLSLSHEAIKSCPDKGCKNIISLPDQNLPLKAAGLTPLWCPGPTYTADQSELGWRGADQSEGSILSQTLNCLEGRREERRGHVLGSVLGLS